jgi:hypothetical protein
MKNFIKGILVMALLGFLSACWGGDKVDKNQGNEPALDLAEYFNGPVKAWGMVQDYTGKVTRRFDIDLVGSWEGNVGTLNEVFYFYDGEEQKRTWTLTKFAPNRYEGTASDIIGVAQGKSAGNAVRLAYQMDLDVGESKYRVSFDDNLYLMNDGVIINRAFIKKFGLTVGELTVFMQKQN